MRLFVDTNVVIDYAAQRVPFYEKARLLFLLGFAGEMQLRMSSSQVTDVFFNLSSGGKADKRASAKRALREIRSVVGVYALNGSDIDAALDSPWEDFEDACVYQAALGVKADAIITRNQRDFARSSVKVMSPDELFVYLKEEKSVDYDEILL